jgi:hypothetical protein
VEVPPLRRCREDLQEDWRRVWDELRRSHDLPGNLRDLQRLALRIAAWWTENSPDQAVHCAIGEWASREESPSAADEFGVGSRRQRIRSFTCRHALWSRGQWGTWGAAARALGCDEGTLREDARSGTAGPAVD